MSLVFFVSAIALITATTTGCPKAPDIAERLSANGRSAADQARDAGRRPAEVVKFFGIEPGMAVMDALTSGGYYTEVLSIAVGPEGKVYGQNIDFTLKMRDGMNDKAITARLAGNRLPNVIRLDAEFTDLGIPPNSLDVVVTALNIHDVIDGRGPKVADAVLRAIGATLKPGGILGVIDHAGSAGNDSTDKELHRIDEARVVAALEAAGYTIDATSDLLRNADDDRTQSVFAPGLRGHTDRFVLRARKAD